MPYIVKSIQRYMCNSWVKNYINNPTAVLHIITLSEWITELDEEEEALKPEREMPIGSADDYDRAKEVKEFDDSKIGVKGLVDSGLTSIPRFFVHPPDTHPSSTTTKSDHGIPSIDLSFSDSHRRSTVTDQIKEASTTWGFFQVINHGIPLELLNRTISSIKAFNEQPTETKAKFYSRDMGAGVSFSTNLDLFRSKAASWRDTLQLKMGPVAPDLDLIPEICRSELVEWDKEAQKLGESLLGILCEGLGLNSEKLKEMSCLEARLMVAHYYPFCPQPDRTVGLTSHTDPGVLTVLLQDKVGGLQVKHGEDWVDVKPIDGALVINIGDILQDKVGGLQVKHDDDWVDVKPIDGALVINIGDILQIMSNDEYKSVEHRVLANPFHEPRVSTGIFFNPSNREDLYGPLPELTSAEKPAAYRQFTLSEYMRQFFSKELDGKSMLHHFKS